MRASAQGHEEAQAQAQAQAQTQGVDDESCVCTVELVWFDPHAHGRASDLLEPNE